MTRDEYVSDYFGSRSSRLITTRADVISRARAREQSCGAFVIPRDGLDFFS